MTPFNKCVYGILYIRICLVMSYNVLLSFCTSILSWHFQWQSCCVLSICRYLFMSWHLFVEVYITSYGTSCHGLLFNTTSYISSFRVSSHSFNSSIDCLYCCIAGRVHTLLKWKHVFIVVTACLLCLFHKGRYGLNAPLSRCCVGAST